MEITRNGLVTNSKECKLVKGVEHIHLLDAVPELPVRAVNHSMCFTLLAEVHMSRSSFTSLIDSVACSYRTGRCHCRTTKTAMELRPPRCVQVAIVEGSRSLPKQLLCHTVQLQP